MIVSDHPHLCEDDPIAPLQSFWFYPLSAAKVEMKKADEEEVEDCEEDEEDWLEGFEVSDRPNWMAATLEAMEDIAT